MDRVRTCLVLLALGVSTVTTPSAATQVGVTAFGGYNTYSMEDVNDFINFLNTDPGFLGGTGYSLDDISSGWGYGAGLRVRPSGDKIVIGLDYERLMASSELEVFDASLTLDVPANAFTGTVFYFFPSTSRARFGLGAGVGYYSSSGELVGEDSGSSESIDVEGSGVGFHGVGAVDIGISSTVHFEGSAGYRMAKTSDVKVGDVEITNSAGDDASIDWSGLMTRLGFTFYFGGGSTAP
ncbi:MAG TPA: hypothetical protein VFV24_06635 [Candidatus Eisenbacteria bacterium]|nr:hypothetical protein [Candidatus Eisenbacteria bacterium]